MMKKTILLDFPEGWRQFENFGQFADGLLPGKAAMKTI